MNPSSSAAVFRFSKALVGRLALLSLTLPATAQVASPSQRAPHSSTIQKLAAQVAQVSANDQRQDIRLYQLERDVDRIQQSEPSSKSTSIEAGGATAPNLVPHTAYQVRKGDSLWRIAMNHRISPGEIMAFNRMPNDTVLEGQVLMIPQKGTASAPSLPVPAATMHTVQVNETYYSIAKKHSVTVDDLARANPNVNPEKLQPGMQLMIRPGKAAPSAPPGPPAPPRSGLAYDPTPPAAKPPAKSEDKSTHIVQPGESLSVIAQRHRVSMSALQAANQLTNPNDLKAGQKLVIPDGRFVATQPRSDAPDSTVAAKKKPGGTMAEKAAATSKPAGANQGNSTPAPPYPVSAPEAPVEPTPPTPPTLSPGANRQVVSYRMEKGDTIDTVAKDFGTTAGEIRRLNRLSATSPLKEGDEILVPGMGAVN